MSASTALAVIHKQTVSESGIEQSLAATNPNYSSGKPEWRRNCQRCVIAYEMNRRGIACEAMPRILKGKDDVASHWRDLMNGQVWNKVGSKNKKTTANNLSSQMKSYGEGSRAVVYVAWKGGGAHVFNAENVGGKIRYVDAQSGKDVDISYYISRSKPTKTMISRIDNLQPNPRYINDVIKRK